MDKKQIQLIRKKSKKQEQNVAKDIGGSVSIASGALDIQKADVRNDIFLIECKTTEKTFYSLKYSTWKKIENEALKDGLRTPVMCIYLRDGDNSVAVLDYSDFLGLDLDKNNFVGKKEPDLIEGKSYRIKPDFLYEGFNIYEVYNKEYYHRRDIKFINQQCHLVLLDWDDFIKLTNV